MKQKLRAEFFKKHPAHSKTLQKNIEKNLKNYFNFCRIDFLSSTFMAYKPFPSEINVLQILSNLSIHNIYLPYIQTNGLLPKKMKSYLPGYHKLYHKPVFLPLYKIDIVIVPALFVEKNGHRLGRGGGYYDRLLRFFMRQRAHKKTIF